MGRKIDMKKIEDITRCQVTFSKRRSSVMKKANEIAVCCDVDIAFLAFSPSGRISKYCNQKRIEDVLIRYVELPADKRLAHISNVQEKMQKLRLLGHIKGDTSKLQYLDKQIENLELQIKKGTLELQILETGLRDYEIGAEQEPSLHQLSWCERNLSHSLEKVNARKNELGDKFCALQKKTDFKPNQLMDLEGEREIPFASNINISGQNSTLESQILVQLDPWISPYSARVRENILEELMEQAKSKENEQMAANMFNFPTLDSPNIWVPDIISSTHFPTEQSIMVDQSFFNSNQQSSIDPWQNTPNSMILSNPLQISSQNSCITPGPRFTCTTTVTPNATRDEIPHQEMTNNLQFSTSNFSQFDENFGQFNIDYLNNIGNGVGEEGCSLSQSPFYIPQQHNELFQDAQFDNFHPQKSSSMLKDWEWEDLLMEEHLNLQDFP